MKKSFLFIIFSVVLLIQVNSAFALTVGRNVPGLKVARWLKGTPVHIYQQDNKKADEKVINESKNIIIVYFWATWLKLAPEILEYVEKEEAIFKDDNVIFAGISKENPIRLKRFFKKYPKLDLNFAVDYQAETYDRFMVGTKGVPMFFVINSKGVLLWKGPPYELDRVLKRILAGTFDIETQKIIEKERETLRHIAQTFDTEKETKYAEKILAIDPTDEVALNIIVKNFIRDGEFKKALDTVEEARKNVGDSKYLQRTLFLIEFDIIQRMELKAAKEQLRALTKNYFQVFKDYPKNVVELSIIIQKNTPLEIIPVDLLLKSTLRAFEIMIKNKSQNKIQLGQCLQSLARLYFTVGLIDKSIRTQKEAVKLIADEESKQTAVLNNDFYSEMKKLKQKIESQN